MSEPPIPPIFRGKGGWVAAWIATALFVLSVLLVAWLWVQDSASPPPGSELPDPVPITTTPQFPQ